MKTINLVVVLVLLNSFGAFGCQEGYYSQFNGPCIPKPSTRNEVNANNACRDISDADDRAACYEGIAETAHNDADESNSNTHRNSQRAQRERNDYDTSGLSNFGMAVIHVSAIVAAGFALHFILGKKKGRIKCGNGNSTPPSMYMISAGALTMLGAEVLSYISYSNKVKELNNDISEMVEPSLDDADTSQDDYYNHLTKKAFNALIDKEKAYLAATKVRKVGHTISASIFGAAMIASIAEGVLQDTSKDRQKYSCWDVRKVKGYDPIKSTASSKNSSGGSSMGAIMGFVPMLLGVIPLLKTSDFDTPLNLLNDIEQLKLPNASQRYISSLKTSESLEEANMIVEEASMLKRGALSSPTLTQFNELKISNGLVAYDTRDWEQQKELMIMGALLNSQYDDIGFLFTEGQVALK